MIKNSQNIKSRRLSSISLIFLIDIALTAFSFVASYKICTAIWPELSTQKLLIQLPVIIAISSLMFLFIGYTKGVVRHDRTREVYSIFNAICLVNILTIILVVVHGKVIPDNGFLIPVSIIIVHSLFSFVALVLSRFVFKKFHNSDDSKSSEAKRVFLAGSGKEVQKLLHAFGQIRNNDLVVAGFVDLDENIITPQINGLPFLGIEEINKETLNDYNVSKFVITKTDNFDSKICDQLLRISAITDEVLIAQFSAIDDTSEKKLTVSSLTKLRIEDICLPKDNEADVAEKSLFSFYEDKRILVLGAAGCVGSVLVEKIIKSKCKKIMLIDKSDDALFSLEQQLISKKMFNVTTLMADILDFVRMEQIFKDFAPDIVVNAAGYKIFDFTKDNLYEAVRLNILGNKLMADLSIKNGVQKFVNLSRSFPIMHCTYARATERIAEIYLNCLNKEAHTEFINIRFGNVLESPSSVLNVFKNQLANGGPIKISSKDAHISFISSEELSSLLVEAIYMGKGGNVYRVDMGEPLKEIELAKQIIELSQYHFASHVDIIVAENPNKDKEMCEMTPCKKSAIEATSNEKLSFIREDDFDVELMKSKITELCVANMSFKSEIIALMDDILKYNLDSKYHDKNIQGKEEKVLKEKLKQLAT